MSEARLRRELREARCEQRMRMTSALWAARRVADAYGHSGSTRKPKPPPIKILVIDDDDYIRQTLAQILEEEGYFPLEADDGQMALDLLEEHASALPKLLVLDLMMPQMDGWTFRTRQLEHVNPAIRAIPCLVISAHRLTVAGQVQPISVDAVLPKPFDLDRLIAFCEKFAGKPDNE